MQFSFFICYAAQKPFRFLFLGFIRYIGIEIVECESDFHFIICELFISHTIKCHFRIKRPEVIMIGFILLCFFLVLMLEKHLEDYTIIVDNSMSFQRQVLCIWVINICFDKNERVFAEINLR